MVEREAGKPEPAPVTIKVKWDKGTTSSVTDYKWDKGGHLAGATLTLAKQTGESNAPAENGYVHEAGIKDDDQRKAYVYSHEMAHVEYAQEPGSEEALTKFHENGQLIKRQIDAAGGTQKAFKDPALRQLNDQQLKQGYELEKGADERAWEAINQ